MSKGFPPFLTLADILWYAFFFFFFPQIMGKIIKDLQDLDAISASDLFLHISHPSLSPSWNHPMVRFLQLQ